MTTTEKDHESFAAMLMSHRGTGVNTAGSMGTDWCDGYEAARLDIGRSIAAILRNRHERFDAEGFYAAAKLRP